ncbi:hypothetical protein B7463_g9296, partial [Scytalidium lignicola]
MLSVASLLNPVSPDEEDPHLSSNTSSSRYSPCSTYSSPTLAFLPSNRKQKMTKDGAVFAKGKVKGEVNFPPFQLLDSTTTRNVQKFQVFPLGKIDEFCRHIPYNSEKKSFLEKTGRESFEVFQYTFKLPGEDKVYTVMWDYNVGLVRITPFFKCCKYSKTTPAKMLNMNPGLKEITHSITGGALAAQGYWMPYSCALAVCTTFCFHIAPALIPIFGPDFPEKCVPPESPEYGRMIIDPSITEAATAEAELFRLQYGSSTSKSFQGSYSPQQSTKSEPYQETQNINSPEHLGRRVRLKRGFSGTSTCETVTTTDLDGTGSETSSPGRVFDSADISASRTNYLRQQKWKTNNAISHSANSSISIPSLHTTFSSPSPWLSAIPRSTGPSGFEIERSWVTKRQFEEERADEGYEAEESGSITDDKGSVDEKGSEIGIDDMQITSPSGSARKEAAWLLMQLSIQPRQDGITGGIGQELEPLDGPRVKRRRAASL